MERLALAEARTFGERVKYARQQKGWSQQYLSQQLGMSLPGVSLWERGERMPSRARVDILAKVLGVKAAWLLGEE